MNNRTTSQNIKIVKSALIIRYKGKLRKEDIRDAVLVFTLKELEHLSVGLPLIPEILN